MSENSLKKELIDILSNLIPVYKKNLLNQNEMNWLEEQIETLKKRKLIYNDDPNSFPVENNLKILDNDYALMNNIASWLVRRWRAKEPQLFTSQNMETDLLRKFIYKCQANVPIIYDRNETIEQTTERILDEMDNHYQQKPSKSSPK